MNELMEKYKVFSDGHAKAQDSGGRKPFPKIELAEDG